MHHGGCSAGYFSDTVLAPTNTLPATRDMVKKSKRVLDLFRLSDAVVHRIDELEVAMEQLHAVAVEHIPECVKKKPHLMRHITDSLSKYKKAFSCYPAERKHKGGKAVCAYTYKKCTRPMAAHDVHELKLQYACPDTYKEILIPEKRAMSKNV